MNIPDLAPLEPRPLVSVLIVNYNYARYLPAAIESVLAQRYQNFEIVICDDGSTDDSRQIITAFAGRDSRLRYIFKENAAVAAALNDAWREARGSIIALLDADDLFTETKLERVVNQLQRGGRTGMVVNTLLKIDAAGQPIGRIPEVLRFDRGELRTQILATAGQLSSAPTSAISMRRECAEIVFPIPEQEFRTEADAYMRTVAALYYAVEVIEEPVTIYRVHSSNVTASTSVNVRWCERGLSAGERLFRVLRRLAEKNGWDMAELRLNPSYCEMIVVRDILTNAVWSERAKNARQLLRAANRAAAKGAQTSRLKALILALAALFPCRAGRRITDQVYLPAASKRLLGRVLTR